MRSEEVFRYSDRDKLKAAYALNLCTVSVSQIIDYDDINILEQEYEMILNNLNLENIPKDEALLNVLKQLLDTITFFRIHKGDKEFIDREYQHKMSCAIWSAVPNFGVVIAGGNPISMVTSLASQIGIGYMNYRRAKAENDLEYARANWQLQRAAIEQLNGLRRELFDTAWRLAAKYDFPDEYRLTEKQIGQYNAILMDTDIVRKYERLDSIKNKFVAYVPFWYHFGNVANQIAQSPEFSLQLRNRYRTYAMEHFEIFHKMNDKKLLREDQIASACALEYIDLLDPEKDKTRIEALIESAIESSGDSCDVLELCAVAYLKIKNIEKASCLLCRLVNEDYNVVLNAQILSNIYVSDYVYKNQAEKALLNYEILESRVEKDYLFPMPLDGIYDIEKLNAEFCNKQKSVLRVKYRMVLKEFIKKYTIRYNKIFPVPDKSKRYDDSYFLDSSNERGRRIEDLEVVFDNKRRKLAFCELLKDDMLIYDMFEVINEMYEETMKLNIIADAELLRMILSGSIVQCKEAILEIIEALLQENFDAIDVKKLSAVTYKDIVYNYFKELDSQLMTYLDHCNCMDDFAKANSELREFCITQSIPDPDQLFYMRKKNQTGEVLTKRFSPKLLGLDYAEIEREHELKQEMLNIIEHDRANILLSDKLVFSIMGEEEFEIYFRSLQKKEILKLQRNTVAVLEDKGVADTDLLLTDKGIGVVKRNVLSFVIPYGDILLKEDTLEGAGYDANVASDIMEGIFAPVLSIAKKVHDIRDKKIYFKYKNKSLNMSKMYGLIYKLGEEIQRKTGGLKEKQNRQDDAKDCYEFLNM